MENEAKFNLFEEMEEDEENLLPSEDSNFETGFGDDLDFLAVVGVEIANLE